MHLAGVFSAVSAWAEVPVGSSPPTVVFVARASRGTGCCGSEREPACGGRKASQFKGGETEEHTDRRSLGPGWMDSWWEYVLTGGKKKSNSMT